MKLGVIALLRNEADVLPIFLPSLRRLFDHVLLLEHGSLDGTATVLREACAARPGWTFWSVEVPGFHQTVFTNFALRHVFGTTDCDHVFVLDADEVLDVGDRAELEGRLAQLAGPRDLGHFFWRNCVPERFDGSFALDGRVWVPPVRSSYGKVMVPRAPFEAAGGGLILDAGNHSATAKDGVALNRVTIGDILHVPIRSVEQIERKAVLGLLNTKLRLDHAGDENFHWLELAIELTRRRLDDADLIGLLMDYGMPGAVRRRGSVAELEAAGYMRRRIAAEGGEVAAPVPDPWRLMAALALEWRPLDGRGLVLELRGDRLVMVEAEPAPPVPEPSADPPAQPTRDAAAGRDSWWRR